LSALSDKWLFYFKIYSGGQYLPIGEVQFCESRKFRFDWAFIDKMIAAEVEGGQWTSGRHTRGAGYANDCEKYNLAQSMGWKVFRFTTSMIDKYEYYIPLFRALGISLIERLEND